MILQIDYMVSKRLKTGLRLINRTLIIFID